MIKTCLVCGAQNDADALLCHKCGAPLPEEAAPAPSGSLSKDSSPKGPAPKRGNQKRIAIVAAIGIVVVAIVVAVVMMNRGSNASPEATLKRMPKNMDAVGGWNIAQLWKYEKLKPVWDNPMVKQGLEQAKTQYGVDILALKSAVGGSRLKDGKIEGFYIIEGKFDAEKIHGLLGNFCTAETTVADHRLKVCETDWMYAMNPLLGGGGLGGGGFGGDFGDPEADESEGSEASIVSPKKKTAPELPKMGDIVVGVWDENTLVAGTPSMIEAWFKGGDGAGENEKMAALLEEVDGDAFGWGAMTLDGMLASMAQVFPEVANLPALKGATMMFEITLRDVLGVRLKVTVADEASAKGFGALVEMGVKKGLKEMNETFALMGQGELVKGTVEVDGKAIDMKFTMTIPDIPGI